MEYGIRKQGNRFFVYNLITRKSVPGASHRTEEEAQTLMDTLDSNVQDADEKKAEGKRVEKSVKSYGRGAGQTTSDTETDYKWKGR